MLVLLALSALDGFVSLWMVWFYITSPAQCDDTGSAAASSHPYPASALHPPSKGNQAEPKIAAQFAAGEDLFEARRNK